jgi:hypothetical protein
MRSRVVVLGFSIVSAVTSVASAQTAPAPSPLGSNSNYMMGISSNNCSSLQHLKVTFTVTEDLVAASSNCGGSIGNTGFSVQLNANAPKSITGPNQSAWQQYVIQVGPQNITSHTQLWGLDPGDGITPPDQTIGQVPSPVTLPAGYTLTWLLDIAPGGNVDDVIYYAQNNPPVDVSISALGSQYLTPIASFELDLVGQGGCNTTFQSGAGIITYSVTPAVTGLTAVPTCAISQLSGNRGGCSGTVCTGETSNSSYGPVPSASNTESPGAGSSDFQQAFWIPAWTEAPGQCATSIGAGDGTSPWITSCDPDSNGNETLYYWDSSGGSGGAWHKTNGLGIDIAATYVAGTGNEPLLLNAGGSIFYGIPGGNDIEAPNGTRVTWTSVPGCAGSITGAFGSPQQNLFVTGCGTGNGGGTAFTNDATGEIGSFLPVGQGLFGPPISDPQGGVRISISSDGSELWLVDSSNQIYQYDWNLNSWQSKPGAATDISAGSGTTTVRNQPPWVVGTDSNLYRWNGSGWGAHVPAPAKMKRVSVGTNGTVWAIDTSGNVWFYD